MTKGSLLFIFVFLFLLGIYFGYYLSQKKWDWINTEIKKNSVSTTNQTISWAKEKDTPDVELNSVEQLVENFLLIHDESQVSRLIEQNYFSSYLLTTQKILQEGKVLKEQRRNQIDDHTDTFLSLLYKVLLKDEKNKVFVEPFKTDKEFIQYFRESIFTGKAIGQDMDTAETIANNRAYCSDEKYFPVEADRKACIVQMDFFHAKSLSDCSNIDKDLFPGWREICDGYFKLLP